MTTTQLSKHERDLADILVNLLRQAEGNERLASKLVADADEMFRTCYGKATGVGSMVGRAISCATNSIAECERCDNEVRSRLEREDVPPLPGSSPPSWFLRKTSESTKAIEKIAERNKDVYPLSFLLMMANSTDAGYPNIQVFDGAKTVLENIAKTADKNDDLWRDMQKQLCVSLQENAERAKNARSEAFGVIKAWASGSEPRREYLKGKGVALPVEFSFSPTSLQQCPPAPAPRNGRKKQVPNANGNGHQQKPEPDNKPWQVDVLNPATGTILESFAMEANDNGEMLVAALSEHCAWPYYAGQTISKLRKVLTASPVSRYEKRQNFRHWDLNWCKLRFGKKYRMLVHVMDGDRKVLIMAGHRTKLYASIGLITSEW